MGQDGFVGHGEVVGGGQALLLRTVLGIGLDLLAEDVAGNGGDDLVGGHRAKAAHRMAPHGESALGPHVWVHGHGQGQIVLDAHHKEAATVLRHVARHGDEMAGPDVPAAQAGRAAVDRGDVVDGRITFRADVGVGKSGLDVVGQGVAGGQRIVHPLHHREGLQMLERLHHLGAGEGAETGHVDDAHLDALVLPDPIHGGLGRLHHAAHAHDGVLRVLHAVAVHHVVAPPGEFIVLVHGVLDSLGHPAVVGPLGDLALHVAVLVLDHAGHHWVVGIEQVDQLVLRGPDELAHELRLGEQHVLDRVGGEEAVLHVEEGRAAVLCGPAADEGQVAGLLRVAGEEDAPAGFPHGHDVVVARVHVQGLAGQRPGADVEDHGQPLAGDGVEHLVHEDEPLPGGEVAHPPAGQGEAFTRSSRAMLRFRLQELQLIAPKIRRPVGHRGAVAAAHGRRGCDGVRTCRLGDVGVHPNNRAGPIGCGRDAGIGEAPFLAVDPLRW